MSPKSTKFLNKSNRSVAEMSQSLRRSPTTEVHGEALEKTRTVGTTNASGFCEGADLFSLISVNTQGLMSAPRATMIVDTPAALASAACCGP
jgi:hypothetical protein